MSENKTNFFGAFLDTMNAPPPTTFPTTTCPTNHFRKKAGILQQLHTDPRGGNRRYWINVPEVDDNAPDIE
jgi:hypothetical protein